MENLESRIIGTETLQQKAKKFIDEFKIGNESKIIYDKKSTTIS